MTLERVLTPRQKQFVALRCTGLTLDECAKSLGVQPRATRRYSVNPLILDAIRLATDDALGESVRRMNAGTREALDVLREVMHDGTQPGATRVRAAATWLDTAFRAREVLDLAERIQVIEERLAESERQKPS